MCVVFVGCNTFVFGVYCVFLCAAIWFACLYVFYTVVTLFNAINQHQKQLLKDEQSETHVEG